MVSFLLVLVLGVCRPLIAAWELIKLTGSEFCLQSYYQKLQLKLTESNLVRIQFTGTLWGGVQGGSAQGLSQDH